MSRLGVMEDMSEVLMPAAALSAHEGGTAVRNSHIIRSLVARNLIELLPEEAAERFSVMFPSDHERITVVPDQPIGLTPRTDRVLAWIESDPIATVVGRILHDNDDGETSLYFAVARVEQVQIVDGTLIQNTYIAADSWETIDPQTGDRITRNLDPNYIENAAKEFGLSD